MSKFYYIGEEYIINDLEYGKCYNAEEMLRVSLKSDFIYHVHLDIKNNFVTEMEFRKLKLLKLVK